MKYTDCFRSLPPKKQTGPKNLFFFFTEKKCKKKHFRSDDFNFTKITIQGLKSFNDFGPNATNAALGLGPLTCLIFLPFMQVSRSTIKVSLTFCTCDLFSGHMSKWSMVRTLSRLWLCHGLNVFFFMSMQRTFKYREFHPAHFPPKVLLYNVFLFSILAVPRYLYHVTCPDPIDPIPASLSFPSHSH